MPLWYVVRDGEIWAWTYAKSQKVRNLERDDRATLQVEDGEQYHELRGVMIEAQTTVHRDTDQPPWQLALERVADRDVARVRTAEPQRDAAPPVPYTPLTLPTTPPV